MAYLFGLLILTFLFRKFPIAFGSLILICLIAVTSQFYSIGKEYDDGLVVNVFIVIDILVLFLIISRVKKNKKISKLAELEEKNEKIRKEEEPKQKFDESVFNKKSHIDNLISKVKLKKYN